MPVATNSPGETCLGGFSMGYQPVYLSNFDEDSGYQTYFEPFMLPAKAMPKLEDAYCWRGRVKRRMGSFTLGRLRREFFVAHPVTLTQQAIGAGVLVADILSDATLTLRATEPYAEIEPGSLRVNVGGVLFGDNGHGVMVPGAGGLAGTINYITGQMTLGFNPALGGLTNIVIVFAYYPALPAMGMGSYEEIFQNFETTVIFDMKYAYKWDAINNIFIELQTPPAVPWSGSNSKLFWTSTYFHSAIGNSIFWATNFHEGVAGDPIRYFNGVLWTDIYPVITPAADPVVVQTCRCILPFKDRLLLFNTWEGTNTAFTTMNYPNRVRWCANLGNPTTVLNWQPLPGLGGYNDFYTDEHIMSVACVKDVIIVKFERSSWKMIYTGNQEQPFAFQKIDSTMGCSATFSQVMFDSGVLVIGPLGITIDDSTSIERVDSKIPDHVFEIQTSSQRTFGIRDFQNELVYWAFTNLKLHTTPSSFIFNNSVLVYNYKNDSWAVFNDSYTCFGKFQVISPTYFSDVPPGFFPDLSIVPNGQNIIGGNQQGFINIVQARNQNVNGPSLSISAIVGSLPGVASAFWVYNHNFSSSGDYWVKIDGILGYGAAGQNPEELNYNSVTHPLMYHVTSASANVIYLSSWDNTTRTFTPLNILPGGTYLGGGRVTVIQNFNITTKVFCPNYDTDQQVANKYVDLLTDTTDSGEYACNVYINELPTAINNTDIVAVPAMLGENRVLTKPENLTLMPQQIDQKKIWHRFSCQVIAQNFQYELKMRNDQMSSLVINNNDFVLYAMTISLSPTGRIIQ